MTSQEAQEIVVTATAAACTNINTFSSSVLKTRGGRVGSGMGTLLEALWGYNINQELEKLGGMASTCEIGWIEGHEYNDFACLIKDGVWDAATRTGEYFRIEAKSMNAGADESKGHFDQLQKNLGEHELLLVLVWAWEPVDDFRISPRIIDYFIGSALKVAKLRDALHLARGGTFVDPNSCPDNCNPDACTHAGEPLNEAGKRERGSGPMARRPAGVSFAANFGGLVRMLKTGSESARVIFREARLNDETAHEYISFVHRNYKDEEKNQYLTSEWKTVAERLDISVTGKSKDEIITLVRGVENYQEKLRLINSNDRE